MVLGSQVDPFVEFNGHSYYKIEGESIDKNNWLIEILGGWHKTPSVWFKKQFESNEVYVMDCYQAYSEAYWEHEFWTRSHEEQKKADKP